MERVVELLTLAPSREQEKMPFSPPWAQKATEASRDVISQSCVADLGTPEYCHPKAQLYHRISPYPETCKQTDLWRELAWGAVEGPAMYCFLHQRIPSGSLRYSGCWQALKESGRSETREGWGSQYVNSPQSINSAGKSIRSALLESRC